MTINQSGWRPEIAGRSGNAPATSTGNKALMLEEPLIFEIGDAIPDCRARTMRSTSGCSRSARAP